MTGTIADYLAQRLHQHGVDTLFGIPGTSCAAVFEAAIRHGLRTVVNSSELDAGYAADGYARLRGLGAVSVSYGVGTLSLINAIAGALVERGPVVVINGGPSARDLWREARFGVLFSHSTGRRLTDLALFREVTAFAERVEQAADAASCIDRAIAVALREQRPVYIEVPLDLWGAPCAPPTGAIAQDRPPAGTEAGLVERILPLLAAAKRPAILLGEEIGRYRFADIVERVLLGSGLPWATTLLAKSVLAEDTPGFVGVYDSDFAPKPVAKLLEDADCLLAIGCSFGIDHAKLVTTRHAQMIAVADGWCRIGDAAPERAELGAVLALLEAPYLAPGGMRSAEAPAEAPSFAARRSWIAEANVAGLSHEQLYRTVDRHLDEHFIVIHDTCLGSYPSADLNVRGRNAFVCCPTWLSIGHSIGAAIGVGMADCRRPLVLCGDGGFQITAPGLSAMARQDIPAIVILIDNGLYAIEQYLIAPQYYCEGGGDPLPYVGLNRWDYPALARAMGFARAVAVDGEAALDAVLVEARSWTGPGLIAVRVDPHDLPPENKENLSCAS